MLSHIGGDSSGITCMDTGMPTAPHPNCFYWHRLILTDFWYYIFNPFTSGYFKIISYAISYFQTHSTQSPKCNPQRSAKFYQGLQGRLTWAFCLLGLGLFLIRHLAIAIALGPLIAFSLLNFVIGNRAMFYSAPIMWFGAAFLITAIARLLFTYL